MKKSEITFIKNRKYINNYVKDNHWVEVYLDNITDHFLFKIRFLGNGYIRRVHYYDNIDVIKEHLNVIDSIIKSTKSYYE